MVRLTVTSVVKSIYNRSTSILTHGNPDSTPDPTDPSKFSTVQTVNDLFPCVDPQTDGADCLEDCSTCTIKYPSRFKVDESEELYGHINGWSTHVLVATGKSDWVRDVTDEEGSVMSALGAQDASKPQNGVRQSAPVCPTRIIPFISNQAHTEGLIAETYALRLEYSTSRRVLPLGYR